MSGTRRRLDVLKINNSYLDHAPQVHPSTNGGWGFINRTKDQLGMMLMSELRWGVKPPFKGLKPNPTVKSEPIRDADEILFENLEHLHETGAITIHDEEVLNSTKIMFTQTLTSLLKTIFIGVSSVQMSIELSGETKKRLLKLARRIERLIGISG